MKTKVNYSNGDKIGNCIFIQEVSPKVVLKTEESKRTRIIRKALFICSCGNQFEAIIDKVKINKASCGCLQREKMKKMCLNNITHGQKKHPLYSVWNNILYRCNDVTNKYYGGRGIKVCERWKDINLFIEDMYSTYSKQLEIDRIDNDGNYEPQNCRWVTKKENCNNRRNNINEK